MKTEIQHLDRGWSIIDCAPGEGESLGYHRAQPPGEANGGWCAANVPGNVHSALIRAGRIAHPYDGRNIDACRWVEDREWWYRAAFVPDRAAADADRFFLTFDGLDTLATIWLNGELLGRHENMFVPAEFEVTGRLLQGNPNSIAIRFSPAAQRVDSLPELEGRCPFHTRRIWIRKAQMSFGWDWCPRLLTAGLWREVRLSRYNSARLGAVFAKTISIADNLATVEVEVPYESWTDAPLTVEASLAGQTKSVVARHGLARLRFAIPDPRLWWTHDLGQPHLYDLAVQLSAAGEVLDRFEQPIGIRLIQVLMEPDARRARGFVFVLNGVKLFAKGANWIPIDSLIGSAGPDRYRELIRLAREANMNMLRVWGGGVYEPPVFYETCDRLGLLVWQDFMFACAPYPDHVPEFLAEAGREARSVVKRLRNHPSIAIWVGNNENDEVLETLDHFYGYRIFHQLLPGICAELDPTRPYWPSSPWGGHTARSEAEGDRHNWTVWHRGQTPAEKDIRRYAEDRSRFISEFGIHASPPLPTLWRHVPQEELAYDSPQFIHRINDLEPYKKKALIMAGYVGDPRNLREYEAFSMLVQAEGLKYAIEHWRRRKYHCGGTLVWQLNDSWPCISWSVLDYHLNPKAGYHYLRRAFAPLLLSLREEPRGVSVWGINDTAADWAGTIEVSLTSFTGEQYFRKVHEARLTANSACQLVEVTMELAGVDTRNALLCVRPIGDGNVQANHHFFHLQKDLTLPPAHVKAEVHVDRITLSTDNLARFVYFDPIDGVEFADNFFDLLPHETRTVRYAGPSIDPAGLKVWHLQGIIAGIQR